ncbi:NADPH-dependent FMN reductase [Owenweeksia hongkongensis]|uniref:NADPH-dependent FMN reductase n=1 Tax=Owenweeksia hongkongensis TaxID=253245 RepID=UPI003A929C4B
MISVICGTHRPQNQTLAVVNKYVEILKNLGEEVCVLKMDDLPANFMVTNTFGEPSHGLDGVVKKFVAGSDKLVFIAPEYNGSYPGILKVFLDAVPPHTWKGKKAALVGVASGRAGNLRGMDHLTDVLHYLRVEVFSLKIPISRLNTLINNGEVVDTETLDVLKMQAEEFLGF